MSLIEVDSLSFRYPEASRLAVDSVSFRVEEGEYLAIVGPNGSGKSTLLRLLAGLRSPEKGSVRVAGLEAGERRNFLQVRAALALVFQSPIDQIVSTVVEEDVAFGPENLGLPREEIARRVEESLAAVGLLGERKRPSLFLSAGQQQRLALAGALALGPRCIAFDEATSMLDPPSRLALLGLMDGLRAGGGTLIHVTHDMEEAVRADRIIVMDEGRIVFDGGASALFEETADGAPPLALRRGLELPPVARAARLFGLPPRVREAIPELAARIARSLTAGIRFPNPSIPEIRGAAPSARPGFELEGVSYRYLRGTPHETLALEDVSFSLPGGASLGLVGRTGSGKSTLLQLLDALAAPSAGRLLALGTDPSAPGADLAALRLRAPLAIQRPESALFEAFAGDDVAYGPRNLGLSGKALVERVARWMDAVGLPYDRFRDRPTRSLSGGEKRRLALAGVLALEPEALLLDEPTQALDPVTRRAVLGIIARRGREGTTVVGATHSMEEAASRDFLAVFSQGRLLAFGPPRRLFYEDFSPAWGLGRPFACELALALEAAGTGFVGRPLELAELAEMFGRPSAEGKAASEGLLRGTGEAS